MSKVSIYPDITKKTGGKEIRIATAMKHVKEGRWRSLVEKVRQAKTEAEKKTLKEKLPYFTGSGTFTVREIKGLKKHSGRLIVDIDDVDVDYLKSILYLDPFVEYGFISASGKGLALVLKIQGERHSEVFTLVEKYFLEKYNIVIDTLCKDVSRARFVSYDPDLFENPNSKTFYAQSGDIERLFQIAENFIYKAPKGSVHNAIIKAGNLLGGYVAGGIINEYEAETRLLSAIMAKPDHRTEEYEMKKVRDGIEHGKKKPLTIQHATEYVQEKTKRDAAMKEVYAFAHEANRSGHYFTDVDVTSMASQHGLKKEHVREAFTRVFEENKEDFGLDKKPAYYRVERFLSAIYHLRKNEINNQIEYKHKNSSKWEICNPDEVFRTVSTAGFNFSLEKLKSMLRSNFVPVYNPFADYFENLKEYNPETDPDFIAQLCAHVQTKDPDFFTTMLKKHLIRSIACALYNKENRYIFVMVGAAQNTGKSSFIRFLAPFGAKYYSEAPIHNDKDSEIAFAENFIYNMEELATPAGIDINRLKAVISKKSVNVRRPFAAQFEQLPRRCNFFGSTNEFDFLRDSENSRWLCMTVGKFDWGYSETLRVDDIWRQAFHLYKTGELNNGQLIKAEETKQQEINRTFLSQDIETAAVIKFFEVCEPGDDGCVEMTNLEIFQELMQATDNRIKLNSRGIGRIMAALRFKSFNKRINDHQARGYYVRRTTSNVLKHILTSGPQVTALGEDASDEDKKFFDDQRSLFTD